MQTKKSSNSNASNETNITLELVDGESPFQSLLQTHTKNSYSDHEQQEATQTRIWMEPKNWDQRGRDHERWLQIAAQVHMEIETTTE